MGVPVTEPGCLGHAEVLVVTVNPEPALPEATRSDATSSDSDHKLLCSPMPDDSGTAVRRRRRRVGGIDVRWLFFWTLFPPLAALAIDFLVGFTADYGKLVNYKWSCGQVLLPSVSRIINLPKERVFWHIGALSHVALRPFLIANHYRNASEIVKVRQKSAILRTASLALPVSGLTELAFTVALTVVGERENGNVHMAFFIGFIVSCLTYFALVTLFARLRKDFDVDIGVRRLFRLKLALFLLTLVLVPSITAAFFLYWTHCVHNAYDVFAALEYVTILSVFGFHSTALIELGSLQISFVKVSG